MVSHMNYKVLNTNDDFEIFVTSKLITLYFTHSSTSRMKSQLIAYLRGGSEQIYWIVDLEGEVHSIWDLWTSSLQECNSNLFS